MIWLVFALLTGLAVMAVLAPLAARGGGERDSDVAFFEEQLAEIARARDEGQLPAEEAEAARAEAARRLLRAEAAPKTGQTRSRRAALIAALAAIVAIPAVSVPLYLKLGHSDLPDMPLAARLEATPERNDLAGAVARIEAHLREHPEDGRGFEVVAPYFLRVGRGEDAIHAFSEALRLLGPTAARYGALGEARVLVAQGVVSAEARADFENALKLDPSLAMARYYLALGAAQAGEKDKAIGLFEKMLADAPEGAGYVAAVKAQIERLRAADAPSGAQGKAIVEMPAAERGTMIRTMVERLAERLAKNGDDLEGWMKLIRAYSVLSETDKARQALADARKAMAAKQDALARIDALAKELKIGG